MINQPKIMKFPIIGIMFNNNHQPLAFRSCNLLICKVNNVIKGPKKVKIPKGPNSPSDEEDNIISLGKKIASKKALTILINVYVSKENQNSDLEALPSILKVLLRANLLKYNHLFSISI